jgi:hypothetical protein
VTPSTHPLQEGSFDPLAMLRRARGDGSDVRSIKLRMLWLRQRVPEARVTTTLVTQDARVVVMAASIALPDGGEGAGHAAALITGDDDLAELIERTELRAIGRALDILGYVVIDQADPSPPLDRPEPAPTARTPTPLTRERSERSVPDEQPQPESEREDAPPSQGNPPGHVQAIRTLRDREGRGKPQQSPPGPVQDDQRERQQPTSRPVTSPPRTNAREERRRAGADSSREGGEPKLEDVSWTAFWEWARATYQLTSRVQLEELLGQSIGQKSPGDVRNLLLSHDPGPQPDDS